MREFTVLLGLGPQFFAKYIPTGQAAHSSIWKTLKESLPDNYSHAIYHWKEGNVPELIILVPLYHRLIMNMFFLLKKT